MGAYSPSTNIYYDSKVIQLINDGNIAKTSSPNWLKFTWDDSVDILPIAAPRLFINTEKDADGYTKPTQLDFGVDDPNNCRGGIKITILNSGSFVGFGTPGTYAPAGTWTNFWNSTWLSENTYPSILSAGLNDNGNDESVEWFKTTGRNVWDTVVLGVYGLNNLGYAQFKDLTCESIIVIELITEHGVGGGVTSVKWGESDVLPGFGLPYRCQLGSNSEEDGAGKHSFIMYHPKTSQLIYNKDYIDDINEYPSDLKFYDATCPLDEGTPLPTPVFPAGFTPFGYFYTQDAGSIAEFGEEQPINYLRNIYEDQYEYFTERADIAVHPATDLTSETGEFRLRSWVDNINNEPTEPGPERRTTSYVVGNIAASLIVEKISLVTDGNAQIINDTLDGRTGACGTSRSLTYGYTHKGNTKVQKIKFTTDAISNCVGSTLIDSCTDSTAASINATHAFITAFEIVRFTFATELDTQDVGTMMYDMACHGAYSSLNHGYNVGGARVGVAYMNRVAKYIFSTTTSESLVGNIGHAVRLPGQGAFTDSHGYSNGGYTGTANIAQINQYTFATDGAATEIGNLSTVRGFAGISAGKFHCFSIGGFSDGAAVDIIEKYPFATAVTVHDVGNLVIKKYGQSTIVN